MTRSRIVLSLVAAAVVALASSGVVQATHSWGNYHWGRTSSPFTLTVVDSVTSAWDGYLDGAVSDWSLSSVLNLTKAAGKTSAIERYLCSSIRGRIRACNYTYGDTGWLGIARIWLMSDGHINKAITAVNDTYFNTATYNTPPWRRLVMCQEVGHDFGLDHQDEAFDNVNLGTCMDYTSDPDGPPSNEHPNAHDYEQLEIIYAHVDGKATFSSGSAAGGGAVGGGAPETELPDFIGPPGEWGRLIGSIAGGRVQIYELNLGGGNRVITRVIWADPAADAR
jgi:hypothetical protein